MKLVLSSVKGSLHPIKSQKITFPWLVIRLQTAVYWRHSLPSAFPWHLCVPAAKNWLEMRILAFHVSLWGWCHGLDGPEHKALPSMPFFGLCHVAARHHTAAPVCGRKALWLDTGQMLTWAYSLSLQWLTEDKEKKDNEKNFTEPVDSLYSLNFKEYLMHMFSQIFFLVYFSN